MVARSRCAVGYNVSLLNMNANFGPPECRFLEPSEHVPGLKDLRVIDFWRWAYSDVLSNRNRSIFAEFVVGAALGVLSKPRTEWDSVDLYYEGSRIEVKSSADIQAWKQKRPSKN